VHLGMETKFAKELPILPEKMIFRLWVPILSEAPVKNVGKMAALPFLPQTRLHGILNAWIKLMFFCFLGTYDFFYWVFVDFPNVGQIWTASML
jgi:hypothetical protein